MCPSSGSQISRPRHRNRHDPVLGTAHAGNLRVEHRRELTRIQMPPLAPPTVIAGRRGSARRARKRCIRRGGDLDSHRAGSWIQINLNHLPWAAQARNLGMKVAIPHPAGTKTPTSSGQAGAARHADRPLRSADVARPTRIVTSRCRCVGAGVVMAATASVSARLKKQFRACIEQHDESARVRLHRAISWLARAEAEDDDNDARFVFLWIAFNAAYAREFALEGSAREQLNGFFEHLLRLDAGKRIAALLLQHFSGPIRTMVANRYVFEPFWRALRSHDSSGRWETSLAAGTKAATRAMLDNRVDIVLSVVFDRLYVLRNQLVHGGATWNSKVNRAQVRDGAHILMALVPLVIELMVEHPEADFGEILFPVLPPH